MDHPNGYPLQGELDSNFGARGKVDVRVVDELRAMLSFTSGAGCGASDDMTPPARSGDQAAKALSSGSIRELTENGGFASCREPMSAISTNLWEGGNKSQWSFFSENILGKKWAGIESREDQ